MKKSAYSIVFLISMAVSSSARADHEPYDWEMPHMTDQWPAHANCDNGFYAAGFLQMTNRGAIQLCEVPSGISTSMVSSHCDENYTLDGLSGRCIKNSAIPKTGLYGPKAKAILAGIEKSKRTVIIGAGIDHRGTNLPYERDTAAEANDDKQIAAEAAQARSAGLEPIVLPKDPNGE